MAERESTAVAVWDFPTRLFHWALVFLLACSWWSAENHAMDWHRLFGTLALGLVIFRLIWGFVGSSTSRFASFVRPPGEVVRHLRSPVARPKGPGHNPLGAYSVLAMLTLLVVQLGSGLLAVDTDGLESGYLSHLVSFETGRTAAEVHEISFNLLLAIVALHVLAILFYLVVRKRNLVTPMVTGRDRQIEADAEVAHAGIGRFVLAAGVAGLIAWWISTSPGF